MASTVHEHALQRLEVALLDQDRSSARYDAAIGTASEIGECARLRAAAARVAVRETWLHWVDDERYRGLNAGPFELLAESTDADPDNVFRGNQNIKPAPAHTPH
jgi:hypothetical protein